MKKTERDPRRERRIINEVNREQRLKRFVARNRWIILGVSMVLWMAAIWNAAAITAEWLKFMAFSMATFIMGVMTNELVFHQKPVVEAFELGRKPRVTNIVLDEIDITPRYTARKGGKP